MNAPPERPRDAPETPGRRLRVALVTTSFPVGGREGSGVFVARLAEHLAARCEVEVVAPAGDSPRPAPSGPAVRAFRYAPRRWQVLAHRPGGLPAALAGRDPAVLLLPALVAALAGASWRAAGRADVVHAQWAFNGVVAGIAGRLRRTPVVVTLRGSDVARAERSALDRRLLALCLGLADAAVAVGPSLAARAEALVPGLRRGVETIPNGVGEEFFGLAPPPERPAGAALRLLGVGNLTRHKDVETVVRAVASLPGDPPVRLVWLGGGPEGPGLARLAGELAAGRIDFRGPVPPSQVAPALAESDAFVLSSRGEGRPNALLEAMAAARPAAAPAVDGVVDLVTDGVDALLYEPGDVAGLARRLAELAADPARRAALGAAARRRIEEIGASWPEAARRYERVYRRVAGPSEG